MLRKRYLFLDDERSPSNVDWIQLPFLSDEEWEIVRDFSQFKQWIENYGLPDVVSFDHDLADFGHREKTLDKDERTGLDCAKFMVDWCLDHDLACPSFFVHSKNLAGKENIQELLSQFALFQKLKNTNIKHKP